VDVLDLEANHLTNREYPPSIGALPAEQQTALHADPAVSPTPGFRTVAGRRRSSFRDARTAADRRRAYQHPVDIEFTANTLEDGRFRVNLLQCRPFQVKIKGEGGRIQFPDRLGQGTGCWNRADRSWVIAWPRRSTG
jgi:pyruvate, water dikinase